MPDDFFHLDASDRRAILNDAAQRLGRIPRVLEKDVWVCWALNHLFSIQDRRQMAFKGGTSLSKVYGVIDRFSEDVDVTVDFQESAPGGEPNRSQGKNFRNMAEKGVQEFIETRVIPVLQKEVDKLINHSPVILYERADASLTVKYKTALDEPGTGYLEDKVMIEFGGRNPTNPKSRHRVEAYISNFYPEVLFPSADVDVLAAERTFWEKVTLIHAAISKGRLESKKNLQFRHWLDVYAMSNTGVYTRARADIDLLRRVAEYKRVFFPSKGVDYTDCLTGKLRLAASLESMVREMESDYNSIGEMYPANPPLFSDVLSAMAELESEINKAVMDHQSDD
ncbi:MAG: nucleotidyl transferase AbiEii/AbiGii toxin family protein [Cyanobacteria bacterium HKST-UBA02]|nr:nucleotidyl transferase AbiEii/AbiGii toxin family protein [Cyanobacteria bacterium HKST-UBA02]